MTDDEIWDGLLIAEQRIALAGRELGSGPATAVARIAPGVADRYFDRCMRVWDENKQVWQDRYDDAIARGDQQTVARAKRVLDIREDREKVAQLNRRSAESLAYGFALALVMLGESTTERTLDEIYEDWRVSSS